MNLEWLNALAVDRAILVTLFLGMLVGSLVTGWLAHRHFKRGGEQLAREARDLRTLNLVLLESLELQGIVTVRRDVKGRITGWQFTARGQSPAAIAESSDGDGRVEPSVSLRSAAPKPRVASPPGP